ncbi:MAG: phosphomannomutase/phosphoglucomutase, partial [Actinobacteria bacterium]|nr:phosphomannomutase/phosphoglucomutase [Actinomycetota bacterium]
SRFLRLNPGATILYNLICSRAVPEVIGELGGTAIRTKNGHSYMKQIMAETGAVFAGEHSGHYYFADNYRADSGLIATMGVLGEMCTSRKSLSELRKPLERYASSGEINTTVADIGKVIDQIAKDYSSFDQDHLDGLTVDCGSWWFNVRPSNTEPLLRLNLEAATRDECDTQVMALLATITAQ